VTLDASALASCARELRHLSLQRVIDLALVTLDPVTLDAVTLDPVALDR